MGLLYVENGVILLQPLLNDAPVWWTLDIRTHWR